MQATSKPARKKLKFKGTQPLDVFFTPKTVAMVSRSADAELNALMLEKFGIEAVRGSGGRDNARHLDKGGAKALIALKKSLAAGKNVAMIADIPHGTPRDLPYSICCRTTVWQV